MIPLRISISKASPGKYALYAEWLKRHDPSIATTDLSIEDDPGSSLSTSDGLILSGGADVDPSLYGRTDPARLCRIEPGRDAKEIAFIGESVKRGFPILGICRGLQILNVALQGTLIIDLPSTGIKGHGATDDLDTDHPVRIAEDSRLASITGIPRGSVNSAHHQAIELVAEPLRAVAWSDDGIIEAVEWKDPSRPSTCMAVQWHPERLIDTESAFSRNLALAFLSDAYRYRAFRRGIPAP